MKIRKIRVHGIKSFIDQSMDVSNYTVIVGENNSGKSNLLFSVLWFFGREKLSGNDINSAISDPFVEITFNAESEAEKKDLKKYLINDTVTIRAIPKSTPSGDRGVGADFHGYIENSGKVELDTENKFQGWESKARAYLGDLVFIPPIKQLADEMKNTASSALNQLVSKYVVARIKSEDEKNKHYQDIVDAVDRLGKFISDGEDSALEQLKKEISANMLNYPGVSLNFKLESPEADQLIKNSLYPHVTLEDSTSLPVSSQGDGYQRSMMFSLLSCIAELLSSPGNAESQPTLYLVEEPEMFLHPNHQTYFRNKLEEMAKNANSQVLITSHSPYFVNNVDNYSQIKRVVRKGGGSNILEISEKEVDSICDTNGKQMANALNIKSGSTMTAAQVSTRAQEITEEDQLRYLLWIDPNRANAFLSQKLILVEGSTEKAMLSFMFNNPDGDFYDERETANISVVDVVGKYHFYKFVKLLNSFGVATWCIYDTDSDKRDNKLKFHQELNKIIDGLEKDKSIIGQFECDPYLEKFLGLEKDSSMPDIHIYSCLATNKDKCRDSANYKKLVGFVRGVIDEKI